MERTEEKHQEQEPEPDQESEQEPLVNIVNGIKDRLKRIDYMSILCNVKDTVMRVQDKLDDFLDDLFLNEEYQSGGQHTDQPDTDPDPNNEWVDLGKVEDKRLTKEQSF